PCMNYTSTTLIYNAHLVNFGAWTLGSWPGWTSPAGNVLPEPIILTGSGYLALVITQAFIMLWLLRKAKARWPGMGWMAALACIIVGITIGDSLLEMALIRTGVYAYPGGIREITLFAGETYQFPMSEGFLFGGLAIGSITALMYFRDDKGQTWVEKGLERTGYSAAGKQWVKFFAIYGYIHMAFFVLYMVPNQWLATHSDPFPEGYPPYMINGMCVAGDQHNECPGPGVSMPRPVNNPF
ncbi:MAG TPA: spirocyclase AveC family protein, partial [Macromonas sp.]|nr:spirocyclase AveC family protein [Macromonas sp.]